jgi:hypothetical protein
MANNYNLVILKPCAKKSNLVDFQFPSAHSEAVLEILSNWTFGPPYGGPYGQCPQGPINFRQMSNWT